MLHGVGSEVELETRYRCTATIEDFNSDIPCIYKACKKCHCALEKIRVKDNAEERWVCHSCSLANAVPIPWYKIVVVFKDDTSTTTFTAFGPSGDKLMGLVTSVLASAPNADAHCIPRPMLALSGRTKFFDITVKEDKFIAGNVQRILHNVFDDVEAANQQMSSTTSSTLIPASSSGSAVTPKTLAKRPLSMVESEQSDFLNPIVKKHQSRSIKQHQFQ